MISTRPIKSVMRHQRLILFKTAGIVEIMAVAEIIASVLSAAGADGAAVASGGAYAVLIGVMDDVRCVAIAREFGSGLDFKIRRRAVTRAAVALDCSPMCPRRGLEFSGLHWQQGLVACADFMSAAGTLFPIAPCGRCSL